jgi:hypothetical protein
MLFKLSFIGLLLLIYQVSFSQKGILQSDPHRGNDTFRVYNYSDTIFKNYQSYPDVKDFLKDRFRFRYQINGCQFIGIANYFYNIEKPKRSTKRTRSGLFNLNNSTGEILTLFGSFDSSFEGDSLSGLVVNGDFGSISLRKTKIGHIAIALDTLRSLQVHDSLSRINRLLVWGSFIEEIAINYLADTLELLNFRADPPLNFKGAVANSYDTRTHYLRIRGKDVDKIDFEYHNFKLYFRGDESYDDKVGVYTALLESFKRKGYSSSYEKLDKEFQEFEFIESGKLGRVANWFVKNWWDYGYNRSLVFRNAIILNLLFFIINIFIFNKLINYGYNIRKFVLANSSLEKKYERSQVRLALAKVPYVFLYTCYIFWGLRLDINNLGIHKIGLFLYVLIQYVCGVICLAYLANLIITL